MPRPRQIGHDFSTALSVPALHNIAQGLIMADFFRIMPLPPYFIVIITARPRL